MFKTVIRFILLLLVFMLIGIFIGLQYINCDTIEQWNADIGGIHGAKSCYTDRDCMYNGRFSKIFKDTGKTCVMEQPNPNMRSCNAGYADGRCVPNEIAKKNYYNT